MRSVFSCWRWTMPRQISWRCSVQGGVAAAAFFLLDPPLMQSAPTVFEPVRLVLEGVAD